MYEDVRIKWRADAAKIDADYTLKRINFEQLQDTASILRTLAALNLEETEKYLKSLPWTQRPLTPEASRLIQETLHTDTDATYVEDFKFIYATLQSVRARRKQLNGMEKIVRDATQFDPCAPTTLGWRCWNWNPSTRELLSPVMTAVWSSAELRVIDWSDHKSVTGVAGIHALRMPRDWKRADPWSSRLPASTDTSVTVHGVVERFGKYVLGTEGWRAEWVFMRELMSYSDEVCFELENLFPEVKVCYPDDVARDYFNLKRRKL